MRATPGLGIAAGLVYLMNRRRRSRRASFAAEHPWAIVGTAASVLTAGMWRLWRRNPRKSRMAPAVAPASDGEGR